MIKVVILCGGQGTRLREETEYKPKPMVEIGKKPIIWHIMKLYSYYQLYDFILCLGYKGDVIRKYFYNYEIIHSDFCIHLGSKQHKIYSSDSDEANWNITLANTGYNAMTGARIKNVEKYIEGDFFLATYGDAVADIDINELVNFHKKTGKLATLTGIQPRSKYGIIDIEGDLVTKFNEKPVMQGYVNGGFFVFEKEIFNYLNQDESCTIEGEPMERLAKDKQLAIYRHNGFWECMDTYRDYEHLNYLYKSGQRPWMIWERKNEEKLLEK